jgi:hypothetical protein
MNSKLVTVEKLANNGENWITWKSCLLSILEANTLLKHIEGSAHRPADPDTFPIGYTPNEEEIELLEKQEEHLDHYLACEGQAKAQIFLTINSSLMLSLQKLTTAKEVWDTVCAEFEDKPKIIQVDLQQRMHTLKCQESDDVCTHLDTLLEMKERLSSMGMIIDDDDFFNVVLASLPESYDTIMSAVITSAATARHTLSPADLSSIIKSEYDCCKIRHSGNTSNQPNKALATNYHGNCRTFKSGSAPNKNINCKIAKKVGHTKADCWAKGGDKGQRMQSW